MNSKNLKQYGAFVVKHYLNTIHNWTSPRIRGTHQHTYTSWFNYVGTLSPRIRSTHIYIYILGVGTLSPGIRGTHQHTYTHWFNYVGTLSSRIRGTRTNLLSKVGTLSPRIRSTHIYIYIRGGYSKSRHKGYPPAHIYSLVQLRGYSQS